MGLGTTGLVDCLRNRPAAARVRALWTQSASPSVAAVQVEEVYRGLLPAEEAAAGDLFRAMHMLPLGKREGEMAGRWRQEFARAGRTLSQSDCLIAAAARCASALLATGNPKDFPMDGVLLEHWPVGE